MAKKVVDQDLKMMQTASIIRGTVINAITMLERVIDTYLSHHFADATEKRAELMQHVFATKFLTFDGKRHIFNKISSLHNSGFKKTELPGIHARLEEFNNHRIYLAHCVIDASEEAVKHYIKTKEITLLSYLHEIYPQRYSLLLASQIANSIYAFIDPVSEIINFSVKR
jgi:hypothetical protein